METKSAAIIEILVWPVFAFAAAAYGLDAWSKQLFGGPASVVSRRRAEGGGERASGEGKPPGRDRPDAPE